MITLDDLGYPLRLKAVNVITSVKLLLTYKVTYSQVAGIRM